MLLNTKNDVKRSGMILLIVVAFLSMFLVVGTTYLLVADSIRRTSDFDLNATDKRSDYALMPDIDPRYMLNFALGQILYDVVDPTAFDGIGKIITTNSSLRGHSLATNMYGVYEPKPTATANIDTMGQISSISFVPGISVYTVPPRIIIEGGGGFGAAAVATLNNNGLISGINVINQGGNYTSPPTIHIGAPNDRPFQGAGKNPLTGELDFVNYTVFGLTPNGLVDVSIRDPQKGFRGSPPIYSRWNPPYTYPDKNHAYLGKYAVLKVSGKINNGSNRITNVVGEISDLRAGMLIDFVPGGDVDVVQVIAAHPPTPLFISTIDSTDPSNVIIILNQPYLPNPIITPTTVRNFSVVSLIPSFQRDPAAWLPAAWLPRTIDNSFVVDPNRHRTLRPRPFDQLTAAEMDYFSGSSTILPPTLSFLTPQEKSYFNSRSASNPSSDATFRTALNNMNLNNQILSPPDADGMDVKNLEGYPGGNDSIWIDAGFPVMTTPDGRKYKALIAPLILDLDGRINLNVAGNLMQRNNNSMTMPPQNPLYNADHASNQGWGRWEINPKKLIDPNDFNNLMSYSTFSGPAALLDSSSLNQWKTYGRLFQVNYLPINSNPPPVTNFLTTIPHSYAQVDFNGAGDSGVWGATTKPTFVGPNNQPINPNGFPTFGQGFGNGQATEHLLDGNSANFYFHARNYNPYRTQTNPTNPIPTDPNLIGVSNVFPVSETASILRWQGKGEPFSKSQLAQLLSNSLGLDMPYASAGSSQPALLRQRIRNMVTTLSADLDRPAMVPIDVDVITDTTSRFRTDPTYGYPIKVGTTRPIVYAPVADTPSSTINRTTPALKLNLNRTLTNYPAYDKTEGGKPVAYNNISNQYSAALAERQDFARSIFDYLKNVTGVAKMGSPDDLIDFPLTSPIFTDPIEGPEVVKVNRWLAQLAVNIVDFIDNDDFNTQFQWDKNDPSRAKEFLFGIEMPRLVINEVFVQARNPDGATNGADAYQVNTVVELLNPLPEDPNPNSNYVDKPGSHTALLQYDNAGTPILNYKLSLIKRNVDPNDSTTGTTRKTGNLKDEINRPKAAGSFETKYFGDLDDQPISIPADTGGIDRRQLNKWHLAATFKEILPGTFYKVGDSNNGNMTPPGSTDPAPPAVDYKSDDLKIECRTARLNPEEGNCPQVVLQRLAVPGLPPQTEPTAPNYNPYITVDVFSKGKMNDARVYDIADAIRVGPTLNARQSVERKTPFLDNRSKPIKFDDESSDNDEIRPMGNSLGAINLNATNTPMPMMMHLDRALINPIELINVPCCFPHEFTQRANRWNNSINYMGFTAYPYAHNWPWFDENTRLYRFLEAVGVSPLQAGEAMHGRALGKVNVNTMHSEEVFQAVADAKPAMDTSGPNNFTAAEVTTGYNNLIGQKPILSFGQANQLANQSALGVKTGLNKSLMGYPDSSITPYKNFLDNDSPDPMNPLFPSTGTNVATYARKELLTKIGNSVTTKSNVFAVWITTGYFEVRDDSTQPPKLGAEIGKADGINIRHRMFAIVDRTNMVNSQLKDVPYSVPAAPVKDVDFGAPGVFVLKSVVPPYNNVSVTAGMLLTFEPNTDNEETISVKLYNDPTNLANPLNGHLVGDFQKTHNPGGSGTINIINRGNPGPWVGYDRTKDRDVVPYAEIIE